MKVLYALAILVTGVPVVGAIAGAPAKDLVWWVLLSSVVWVFIVGLQVIVSWAKMIINNELSGAWKMVLVVLGFYVLVTTCSSIIFLSVPMIRFEGVTDPSGIGTVTMGVAAIMSVLTHFTLSGLFLMIKWTLTPIQHPPSGLVRA